MGNYTELTIVYGSNGKLGKAFCETVRRDSDILVARFSSNHNADVLQENERYCPAGPSDVRNTYWLSEMMKELSNRNGLRKINLIYPIGPFKFEMDDLEPTSDPSLFALKQGVQRDPKIFEVNVRYFRLVSVIVASLADEQARRNGNPIQFNMVAFGSLSDRFSPPQWHSYSESKNVLRRYIGVRCKNSNTELLTQSGLFINTSTIATAAENSLRPLAPEDEIKYWLSPSQVVTPTLERLQLLKPAEFAELDIYNPYPYFNPEMYAPTAASLDRWISQMGTSIGLNA